MLTIRLEWRRKATPNLLARLSHLVALPNCLTIGVTSGRRVAHRFASWFLPLVHLDPVLHQTCGNIAIIRLLACPLALHSFLYRLGLNIRTIRSANTYLFVSTFLVSLFQNPKRAGHLELSRGGAQCCGWFLGQPCLPQLSCSTSHFLT